MQCGAGARPEWSGKRLVALKRMKRVWEGGWSQAKNLGEIYVSKMPFLNITDKLTIIR
jgi:meiosis induction protein kinase IME2/SME1